MFGRRYFGGRYFGARYWGDGGAGEPADDRQTGGFLPYAKGERRRRGLEWDRRKPIDELVEEVYARLNGDLREAAYEGREDIRAAVAPFAESSDAPIPPPAAIDFAALAKDLNAAQALLAAYDQALQRKAEQDDEDDAIMVLLLS